MILDYTTRYNRHEKNPCVQKSEEVLGYHGHLAKRGVRIIHVQREALRISTF